MKLSIVKTLAQNANTLGEVKPDYKVPLLKDIRKIKASHSVVSLFAGAGGSSLGYRMAGYKILLANEFVESAIKTYALNKSPTTILDSSDIRVLDAENILNQAKLKVGELDILDGSPPCNTFSLMGKRDKSWGKVQSYHSKTQICDDLFFEYSRILKALQPKVFVAENVPGMVMGRSKGYFIIILKSLKDAGYRVTVRELDSSKLGVPQVRKRIIFIGVRNDLELEPMFPTPLKYGYVLRDVLNNLNPKILKEDWLDSSRHKKTYNKIVNLSQGQHSTFHSTKRAHYEKPVCTINGGAGSHGGVYHPTENRKFTIPELKRICSFPDDYEFVGSKAEQGARLGLAVPPVMMFHIASTIKKYILTGNI